MPQCTPSQHNNLKSGIKKVTGEKINKRNHCVIYKKEVQMANKYMKKLLYILS
jgi:hypothetical protein